MEVCRDRSRLSATSKSFGAETVQHASGLADGEFTFGVHGGSHGSKYRVRRGTLTSSSSDESWLTTTFQFSRTA